MKSLMCLLLALLLCASALAEGDVQKLELDEIYELDLDGDGVEESVQARMQENDDMENLQLVVQTEELVYLPFDTFAISEAECYAADLDGDGKLELLLCGDEASADFSTWCLKFDRENGLQCVQFADANRGENTGDYFDFGYGRIEKIDGNVLTLSGSQDALGTWWCTREFTLRDGRFELDDGGVWRVVDETDDPETWEYQALTLTRELNVTMEDGSEETLPAGTRFVITETDKTSYVGFQTEDGARGTFPISFNEAEGWGFLVNGEDEYSYFEYIPYAD